MQQIENAINMQIFDFKNAQNIKYAIITNLDCQRWAGSTTKSRILIKMGGCNEW